MMILSKTRLHIFLLSLTATLGVVLAAPATYAKNSADSVADASVQAEAPGEGANQSEAKAKLTQSFQAPKTPRVAARLKLHLSIKHPRHTTIKLPADFPNPRWEFAEKTKKNRVIESGLKTAITLVFQIFRPGQTTLPAFEVKVMGAKGPVKTLKTKPVEVKIISVLPAEKTPKLKPARSPVAVWTRDYTLLWAGGALLGLVAAGVLAFLFVRRQRPPELQTPPRAADLVALEKLQEISAQNLLDRGDYMLYYVRISEAIREYLGRRYGFRGIELTTREIMASLRQFESSQGWPKSLSLDDLRQWLEHCDLVKFSDTQPERDRAQKALRQAFSIIELTRVQPSTSGDKHDTDDTQVDPDTQESSQDENPETPEKSLP